MPRSWAPFFELGPSSPLVFVSAFFVIHLTCCSVLFFIAAFLDLIRLAGAEVPLEMGSSHPEPALPGLLGLFLVAPRGLWFGLNKACMGD